MEGRDDHEEEEEVGGGHKIDVCDVRRAASPSYVSCNVVTVARYPQTSGRGGGCARTPPRVQQIFGVEEGRRRRG